MNLIGIDEVGRGALAGPVVLGIFFTSDKNLEFIIKNSPATITDSKKVSKKNRELIFSYVAKCKKEGLCSFVITSATAEYIDKHGIQKAIYSCVCNGLKKIEDSQNTEVLLDGGLRAPEEYTQKTIIKGDMKEPVISLASIIAKVYRDNLMTVYGTNEYTGYGFENHVGYGTKEHYKNLSKKGISKLHRHSYLKNLKNKG